MDTSIFKVRRSLHERWTRGEGPKVSFYSALAGLGREFAVTRRSNDQAIVGGCSGQ
jgi:hypothetical protein